MFSIESQILLFYIMRNVGIENETEKENEKEKNSSNDINPIYLQTKSKIHYLRLLHVDSNI